MFEAALEVMVLLKPDGTVLALNNRREAWRDDDPSQAIGTKLWDAPTMRAYPQHIPVMKKGIAAAARGKQLRMSLAGQHQADSFPRVLGFN